MKKLLYFLSLLVFSCVSAQVTIPKYTTVQIGNFGGPLEPYLTGSTFRFDITNQPITSAGVYRDNVLIRTLWSAVKHSVGTHSSVWDGRDDLGNIAPFGNYEIRVQKGNPKGDFVGVVGNSSDSLTGESVHKAWISIESMCFAGNNMFMAKGYSEGSVTHERALISNPNGTKKLIKIKGRDNTSLNVRYNATDGKRVYWAGGDSWSKQYPSGGPYKVRTMVFATDTSTANNEIIFLYGVKKQLAIGFEYASVINLLETDITGLTSTQIKKADSLVQVTGLAVQKTGNYLFVAHRWRNKINVLNKLTGQLLHEVTISQPRAISVDTSGKLWVTSGNGVLQRFNINLNGSLGSAAVTVPGTIDPLATAVSPDNTTLAICEGGILQYVRGVSNSDGSPLWSLGSTGGYSVSSEVTNTKFYWKDLHADYATFIAYQPDGSFWVSDAGNHRSQHYAANRAFLGRIMQMGKTYCSSVDANDSTRFFLNFCEFKIDYSKSLAPDNGSWELTHNWGYPVDSAHYSNYQLIRSATTLSNGRTYALSHSGAGQEVVELVNVSILRYTGVTVSNSVSIRADGNLYELLANVNPQKLTMQVRTGYSGNNPVWSATKDVVYSIPFTKSNPVYRGNPFKLSAGIKTQSGVYVSATTEDLESMPDSYFHLGLIKDSVWLAKTDPGTFTEYTGDFPIGYFDVGNNVNYAGVWPIAAGNTIYRWYHGENWKPNFANQTTKCDAYSDIGLMIFQFGYTLDQVPGYAPFGMAGNCFSPSIAKFGTKHRHFLNDEGYHGGAVVYDTDSTDVTIQTIYVSSPGALASQLVSNRIDLMQGLGKLSTLANGVEGWTRTPSSEILTNPSADYWSVKTGYKSYDRFSSNDIYATFASPVNATATIERELGNKTASSSWTLTGEVAFYGMHNLQGSGVYLEVLDDSGKPLIRLNDSANAYTDGLFWVKGNGQIITSNTRDSAKTKIRRNVPFKVIVTASNVTITYGSYPPVTAPIVNNTANWAKPSKFQIRFVRASTGQLLSRSIGVDKLVLSVE